jgi:hypothetical protein
LVTANKSCFRAKPAKFVLTITAGVMPQIRSAQFIFTLRRNDFSSPKAPLSHSYGLVGARMASVVTRFIGN